MKKIKPCHNCPWRKDQNLDSIPGYSRELHKRLVEGCQRDGLNAMACHKSTDDSPHICAGFAVQVGFDSIGIRLLHVKGLFNPDDYEPGDAPLHETLEDTLRSHNEN